MTTINELQTVPVCLDSAEMEKVDQHEAKAKRRGGRQKDTRPRKHLESEEVEALIHAAKDPKGRARYGLRDAAIVTLSCNHGFRVSELCALTWAQVDLQYHRIHILRLKNGLPSVHPMAPEERKLLGRLYAWYVGKARNKTGIGTPPVYVIQTERGTSMTRQNMGYLMRALGREAQIDMGVHPHQFRHTAGNHYANEANMPLHMLSDFLGHRKSEHTRRYIGMSEKRFGEFMGPIGRRTEVSR